MSNPSNKQIIDKKLIFLDAMLDLSQESEEALKKDNLSFQDKLAALSRLNTAQKKLYGENSINSFHSEANLGIFLNEHKEPELALKHLNTANYLSKNIDSVEKDESMKVAIETANAYLSLDNQHTEQAEQILKPYSDTEISSPYLRCKRDLAKSLICFNKNDFTNAIKNLKSAQESLNIYNKDSQKVAELNLLMTKILKKQSTTSGCSEIPKVYIIIPPNPTTSTTNPSNTTTSDTNPSNTIPSNTTTFDTTPSNTTTSDTNPSNTTTSDTTPSNTTTFDTNPSNTTTSDTNPSNTTTSDTIPSNTTTFDTNPSTTTTSDTNPSTTTTSDTTPSDTTTSDNVPIYLSNYELLDLIDQGSFSKIYKVKDKNTGNIYAAKISKQTIKNDRTYDLNLKRELNILSQLNHPAILKFICYSPLNFKNKPKPVIITEYAQNHSLQDHIKFERESRSHKYWDDTHKLIILFGIACAMNFLHSRKIIHRNLKPSNILLDEHLHPKITDFGLSEINHQKEPIYWAPEIWEEIPRFSEESDVYAFGMIMYEVITGANPFSNVENIDLKKIVKSGISLSFDTDILEPYQYLIKGCLDVDPTKRPKFQDIVDQLKYDPEFRYFDTFDEDEFTKYIDFIVECEAAFDEDPSKDISQFIASKEDSFRVISIDIPEWNL